MSNLKTFSDEYGNKNFYLKLDHNQAVTLYTILLHIGGHQRESPRKYIKEIFEDLSEELHKETSAMKPQIEIFKIDKNIPFVGIYFKDGFEKQQELYKV